MLRRFSLAFTAPFAFLVAAASLPAAPLPPPADGTETITVDQIKPGMKGIAYTIFSGDLVEPMDLEVLGILRNSLGPKADVILVELHGEKVEHSGVVEGMSGSPVYIEGKLAGALSLKMGMFTKEAIAGVTPIQSMLDIEKALGTAPEKSAASITSSSPVLGDFNLFATRATSGSTSGLRISLPPELLQRASLNAGSYLVPIDTPLIFSGILPQTLAQFGDQFRAIGMTAMIGGTDPASPDDAKLKPGDMVGMELVSGDASMTAGCTVTALVGDRVYACGHPLFSLGDVTIPLSRGHVITTLNSAMASTKIMSTSGLIGTLIEDRTTAVVGRLGAAPTTIPLDVDVITPQQERHFHFNVAQIRQLTPLLVALATMNGISANTAYTEGTTLQLHGTITLAGHAPIEIENYFVPLDAPVPGGTQVAMSVMNTFSQIYINPYEMPKVEHIELRVTSQPERHSAVIESAWSEKSEAAPGETIRVKVLLRPYRGEPFIQEIPVTIPAQAARGPMELVVCDGDTLNRTTLMLGLGAPLSGLDELVTVLNRERHNDRLYAALLQPTPTLLVEDKELPNVPLSEINILSQRQYTGGARLLNESAAGEWSVPMNQVISGQHSLTITVK
jgi:hypothetical protein